MTEQPGTEVPPQQVSDSHAEAIRRYELTKKLASERAQAIAMKVCAADPVRWINDFIWTYNPNRLDMPDLPMVLFPRQVELVRWVESIVAGRTEGVLEKSREIGASWLAAAFALHHWLFVPGFRTAFTSYKADLIDQHGDADSLFEKMRMAIDMLPGWMRPKGYRAGSHDHYMRLINPENGNQIVGQTGDRAGRGGRSSLYWIDEASFLDAARSVRRAVSRNADARIWASTPSEDGMFTVFYEMRQRTLNADSARVFRFHYSDDPRRTPEWVAAKRAEMEPEDWAAEQEIDYSGATERALMRQVWIEACVQLGKEHGHRFDDWPAVAGLDVGAGKAESVVVLRRGPCIFRLRAWRDPDSVDTAAAGVTEAAAAGATTINYDATGVGMAQGAIMGRMAQANGIRVVGVNGGDPVPEHIRIREGEKWVPARDRLYNVKAAGWWDLRERAKRSWEVVTGKADHPLEECLLLCLDPRDTLLEAQLCQPTWSTTLTGKRIIDKAPRDAKSPDRADGAMLTVAPTKPLVRLGSASIVTGSRPAQDGGQPRSRRRPRAEQAPIY